MPPTITVRRGADTGTRARRDCCAYKTYHFGLREFPMRKSLAMAFLSLFLLSGAAAVLTACNTAAGIGEDVSAVGRTVTGGAERTKPY